MILMEKGSRVMTESDKNFDSGSFFIGLVVGFFLTFFVMQIFGVNKWHDRTCQEQVSQAVTASDTLSVIRIDTYCNTELDR